MIILKQQLYLQCKENIDAKIDTLQQAIHAAQTDAQQETKSSAGDKYETGRAMMHLELEKLSGQVAEFVKARKVLDQIDPSKHTTSVQIGSVILTDRGNYFLASVPGYFR